MAKKRFQLLKGGKKAVKRRQTGARQLLTAMGVIAGRAKGAGPGRPRGTYKYGMPIHIYKKKMAERKALYRQYQQEQQMRLVKRGLTPEQIQQLQMARTIEEKMPVVYKDTRKMQMHQALGVADDEKKFRQWAAMKTISPNTQSMLTRLRRIQNKGAVDNIEMQRRLYEKKLLLDASNMFKAHENMNKIELDFTGVDPETNVLMAPNVFRENPENNILRPTGRLNILQPIHRLKF